MYTALLQAKRSDWLDEIKAARKDNYEEQERYLNQIKQILDELTDADVKTNGIVPSYVIADVIDLLNAYRRFYPNASVSWGEHDVGSLDFTNYTIKLRVNIWDDNGVDDTMFWADKVVRVPVASAMYVAMENFNRCVVRDRELQSQLDQEMATDIVAEADRLVSES